MDQPVQYQLPLEQRIRSAIAAKQWERSRSECVPRGYLRVRNEESGITVKGLVPERDQDVESTLPAFDAIFSERDTVLTLEVKSFRGPEYLTMLVEAARQLQYERNRTLLRVLYTNSSDARAKDIIPKYVWERKNVRAVFLNGVEWRFNPPADLKDDLVETK